MEWLESDRLEGGSYAREAMSRVWHPPAEKPQFPKGRGAEQVEGGMPGITWRAMRLIIRRRAAYMLARLRVQVLIDSGRPLDRNKLLHPKGTIASFEASASVRSESRGGMKTRRYPFETARRALQLSDRPVSMFITLRHMHFKLNIRGYLTYSVQS